MSFGKRDYLPRLQTLLFILILNGMAKTKFAILPFLCCGEIVKNCIAYGKSPRFSKTSRNAFLSGFPI